MEGFIVETRPIASGGNIKATLTVSIPTDCGPITIHQAKLIQKPGEAPWVALPRGSYAKDGVTHWVNHIELPWQLRRALLDRAVKALEAMR